MTTKLYSLIAGLKILLKQLWLSISSVDFYQDVYKIYSGYGIKYLFTISFISTLIYCSILLSGVINFRNYFTADKESQYTTNLEYIIQQLPDFRYDGTKIYIEEDTPLFLYNNEGSKIAVIDLENKLDYDKKNKIPVIFTSSKILISFFWDKKRINFPVEYKILFGSEQQVLTKYIVKKRIGILLNDIQNLFIYVLTPILIIFTFIASLVRACLLVILVYLATQLLELPAKMKTCIRLALFASGAHTFLAPLISIIVPGGDNVTWIMLLLPSVLLFLSILKMKNSN
ncbi:MAG: DUF1189 family protein [Janthinobacterium lividum]